LTIDKWLKTITDQPIQEVRTVKKVVTNEAKSTI